jgi:hypothetical protein
MGLTVLMSLSSLSLSCLYVLSLSCLCYVFFMSCLVSVVLSLSCPLFTLYLSLASRPIPVLVPFFNRVRVRLRLSVFPPPCLQSFTFFSACEIYLFLWLYFRGLVLCCLVVQSLSSTVSPLSSDMYKECTARREKKQIFGGRKTIANREIFTQGNNGSGEDNRDSVFPSVCVEFIVMIFIVRRCVRESKLP